jgi:hypothetical protein
MQTALSNSKKAVSFSSERTTKRLQLSRCASAIHIVFPCASTAVMQPQLHPALLGNVSDDFPILHRDACALLIVQNGLRYSFARFRKIIQDSQDHDARPCDMIFPELAP